MYIYRTVLSSMLAVAYIVLCPALFAADFKTAFAFPEELAGFRRGSQVDFESRQPGLGIGFPYDAAGVKATVYVYNSRIADLPEGIESSIVRAQAQQAESDVFEAYGDVRVLDAQAPGTGHCTTFLRTKFSFVDSRRLPGKKYRSYLYLSSRKGNFIKARISYTVDADASSREAAAERFAQALCEFASK